jgi:hypothetical protein
MKSAAIFSAALLALASSANAAVNLVQNPGFETGDFTGWTTSGTPGVFVFPSPASAHSGSNSVSFQDSDPYGFISQNIPTTAGHTYQIDYYLYSLAGGDFFAKWNGSTIPGSAVDTNLPYTLYSFQLPATSASTPLEFYGYNFQVNFFLDDVSVIDLTPAPEPASLSLLAIGAAALLRRRRS